MIESVIDFAIRRRWVVVVIGVIAAGLGAFALTRLPIDAVPDITNKQVQINTIAPALSPVEIEKQVTFPIETALASKEVIAESPDAHKLDLLASACLLVMASPEYLVAK